MLGAKHRFSRLVFGVFPAMLSVRPSPWAGHCASLIKAGTKAEGLEVHQSLTVTLHSLLCSLGKKVDCRIPNDCHLKKVKTVLRTRDWVFSPRVFGLPCGQHQHNFRVIYHLVYIPMPSSSFGTCHFLSPVTIWTFCHRQPICIKLQRPAEGRLPSLWSLLL